MASSPCSPVLTIHLGPTIVTAVQTSSNAPLNHAPILPGVLYDLHAASMMTGRSVNALRVTLHRHADQFDQPPRYTKRGKRFHRLISAQDLAVLRAKYPIYVKQNQRMSPIPLQ